MASFLESRTICLDEEGLESLERRLDIAMSKLTPGTTIFRGEGVLGDEALLQVPQKKDLEEAASEIIENARRGIQIAPQIESRPLIPMFKLAKVKLPPEIRIDNEKMHYEFYLVEVTFSILLPKDQFPLSTELELNLTDDITNPVRRTRPIRLFPGRKDTTLFSLDLLGAVGIDVDMNISVPHMGFDVFQLKAAAAEIKLNAGIVVGPFFFQFRKAAIEVKGESSQNIFWRYNFESTLSGANDFKSLLILKIAEEANAVQMSAHLSVVPYKRRWLLFKNLLPKFSDHMSLPIELTPKKN